MNPLLVAFGLGIAAVGAFWNKLGKAENPAEVKENEETKNPLTLVPAGESVAPTPASPVPPTIPETIED